MINLAPFSQEWLRRRTRSPSATGARAIRDREGSPEEREYDFDLERLDCGRDRKARRSESGDRSGPSEVDSTATPSDVEFPGRDWGTHVDMVDSETSRFFGEVKEIEEYMACVSDTYTFSRPKTTFAEPRTASGETWSQWREW